QRPGFGSHGIIPGPRMRDSVGARGMGSGHVGMADRKVNDHFFLGYFHSSERHRMRGDWESQADSQAGSHQRHTAPIRKNSRNPELRGVAQEAAVGPPTS